MSTMKLPTSLVLFVLLFVSASHGIVLENGRASSSRRTFVEKFALVVAGSLGLERRSARADDNDVVVQPFCVIGANGRTGTKCVQGILDRKIPVRATSRTGIYNDGLDDNNMKNNPLLIPTICDVTDPFTIDAAVAGSRAVIFAASASKSGGTPTQVDNQGLVNVAKACINAKVPHLVIVSSGGVSKPDSPIYKFLNVFGGIMEQKIKGEDTIRKMYSGLEGMTYTVIRPGGLTEDAPLGVGALELNQGDTKSGRISRYDVANLCIESTFWPRLTGGATFECYNADTAKSLGKVGVSNILKQTSKESDLVSGFERRGNTFEEIFTGLEKDV